jgi:alpha-L-arabinofuranosidase
VDGEPGPLNLVATKSADGNTMYVKAVNTSDAIVPVILKLASGAARKSSLLLVAPGDLSARNTLEARNAVQPQPAAVRQEGSTLRFTLPPISCGVVKIQ